jgi:hypothetical protein
MNFPEPMRSAWSLVRDAIGTNAEKRNRAAKTSQDRDAARERIAAAASVLADDDADPGVRTKALKEWREAKDELELLEMLVPVSQEKTKQSQATVQVQKKAMAAAWKSYCDARIAGAYATVETANERYNAEVEDAFATARALGDKGLILMQMRTVLPLRGSQRNGFQPIGENWSSVIKQITDIHTAVMAVLHSKEENS